jgi:hypothetical protein
VEIPPPQVFQFDGGGFIKYLEYAHQAFRISIPTDGARGDCGNMNRIRNNMLSVAAFENAPEPWQAMVAEYNGWRTKVLAGVDPVYKVCQGGGGTLPLETAQQINALSDKAQNRMYEMLQQAKAMIK